MENQQTLSEKNAKEDNYIEIEMPYHLYQILNSGQCNLEALCRICLVADSNLMFPLIDDKQKCILADMYTVITCVPLLPDEGLPTSICETCHSQLLQCYEFKIKSERSNCLLKSITKGEFILKETHISEMKQTEDQIIKSDGNEAMDNNKIDVKLEIVEDDNLEETLDNDDLLIVRNTRENKKKKVKGKINTKGIPKDVVDHKQKKQRIRYECDNCGKKYSKLSSLRVHMRDKHPIRTHAFPCAKCKLGFDSAHDLNIHSTLHNAISDGKWKCSTCGKFYKNRTMLRRHLKRHMESKPYKCEACGKAFVELYALRRHNRVHTGEFVEKKHACHLCDKRYTDAKLLANHISRHEGLRPCECETCGKRFPSARLLGSHRRVHSDRKPHACHLCDRRFRHESTLQTHVRTHTGERPYVCSACGKAFIQHSNLTLHMRSHTGEKPYSCSKCDKKFSSGSTLKSHMRIHTGERPYSCHICGKKFAQHGMRAHMASHGAAGAAGGAGAGSGALGSTRSFSCSACARSFPSAARLRDHTRVHTGEKPFECKTCSRKFAKKHHLLKHEKLHTMKQPIKKKAIQVQHSIKIQSMDNEVCKEKKESPSDNVEVEESSKLMLQTVQEIPIEVAGELVVGGVVVFLDNNQPSQIS